jgi:hypothetical protein
LCNNTNTNHTNDGGPLWVELDLKQSHLKVGHALRDAERKSIKEQNKQKKQQQQSLLLSAPTKISNSFLTAPYSDMTPGKIPKIEDSFNHRRALSPTNLPMASTARPSTNTATMQQRRNNYADLRRALSTSSIPTHVNNQSIAINSYDKPSTNDYAANVCRQPRALFQPTNLTTTNNTEPIVSHHPVHLQQIQKQSESVHNNPYDADK